MPGLARYSEQEGIVFTQAYAPGPTSPSSHSSFFTGELPSNTGMYEANPYFTRGLDTIADVLEDRRRFVISSNPFIFNGLCDGFDVTDDLRSREFMLFKNASDPITDGAQTHSDTKVQKYRDFLLKDGKPIRSLLNGISYKISQKKNDNSFIKDAPLDSQDHQFSKTMVNRIQNFLNNSISDSFIFANFMDVHAPLDASNEALNKFAPEWSRDELPIGISGQKIHTLVKEGDTTIGEKMYDLYKAAIWDLDNTISPFIRERVDAGDLVIVTADHGNWFSRESELDEERIHVPLILFAPEEQSRTIDKTVNLRSLPRTTMEILENTDGEFSGENLTEISDHQLSITELIHDPETPGSPVEPHGDRNQSIQYDIATVRDQSRVDYVDGEYQIIRDNGNIDELKNRIKNLRSDNIDFTPVHENVNATKEDRLRQLGYLE